MELGGSDGRWTLVIGLGNPILTDDGVGVRVAEAVRTALPPGATVEVREASVGGLTLMEQMVGYQRVILVDAFISPAEPTGAIRRMTLDELHAVSPTQNSASTHDTTLVTALEMGRRMGLPLPDEVVIYGVAVTNVIDFSESLTPAVAAAIPAAAAAVLAELGLPKPAVVACRTAYSPLLHQRCTSGAPTQASEVLAPPPTVCKEAAMVSTELIRRYPLFAGLTANQIEELARAAEEERVDADDYFFHEGEILSGLWLVVEGVVAVVMELPNHEAKQSVADQLTGALRTRDVIISTVGPGQVFGWSALVPPYSATATTKSMTDARVVRFDAESLRERFEDDCTFGYVMTQRIAQVTRDRLRDMRIQSLTLYAST